jgi:predicted nucleic acid-binding protein
VKRVIDTSVLIDHLRGRASAVELLSQAVADGDELWSVTAVRTEILAGMRKTEEVATRRLLHALAWQTVSISLADQAGMLASRYLRSHPGVDTVDYLVAATALDLGADLWTCNVKHFPMFPDLERPY